MNKRLEITNSSKFPSPIKVQWDQNVLQTVSAKILVQKAFEATLYPFL